MLASFDVVIADDDPQIREALGALLDDHPALRLVGAAGDGIEAAKLCAAGSVQLVVLDVMMPAGGIEAMAAVRAASPTTVVAFYTAMSDRRTKAQLMAAGADAVFVKGDAIDLAAALHDVVSSAANSTA